MRVKQKGIRNTPNKPWWVEIVTSRNRLYRPYAISEHSLFIYHWEFTHEFFQGKPNIDEYFQIQTSAVQERNCMKSESLSKVHSWESLIFQICNQLFHRFSKYIYSSQGGNSSVQVSGSNSWLCPFKWMWNLWAWTKLHSTKMVKKPTECRLIKFFFLVIGRNNLVLFCTKMKLHFQTSSFS